MADREVTAASTEQTRARAMREQPLPMLYQDEHKILETLDEIFGGDKNYRLRVCERQLR